MKCLKVHHSIDISSFVHNLKTHYKSGFVCPLIGAAQKFWNIILKISFIYECDHGRFLLENHHWSILIVISDQHFGFFLFACVIFLNVVFSARSCLEGYSK